MNLYEMITLIGSTIGAILVTLTVYFCKNPQLDTDSDTDSDMPDLIPAEEFFKED